MSVTSWFLVSSGGTRHRLPREMIFVGRDDCELMLQSRSVDKQHAVINYEAGSDEHKVKDLGSLNGTFVNDVRIQEQMYITLKLEDKLRFGYDTNLFTVVRGELTVPEEALKHEKFTSGLQLSKKPANSEVTTAKSPAKSPTKTPTKNPKSPVSGAPKSVGSRATDGASPSSEPVSKLAEPSKGEDKLAGDIAALHRGTPLYGQPSWWGDGDADDENSFKQETKTSNKKQDSSIAESREARRGERAKEDGLRASPGQEYFEVPTREAPMAHNGIHEVPTKDTEGAANANATTAQGHASFTIEFDSTSPGKVTIKDHVSKVTADAHHPRPRKSGAGGGGGGGGRDLSTLQAAMMASECKVADWLAQNDPTLVRSESTEEDSKSIKSDVPVHLKRLKGSKHEDGTQSDSENGLGLRFASRRHALEERLKAAHAQGGGGVGAGGGGGGVGAGVVGGARTATSTSTRTAFMIEFYDEENPRKRRSYSFSQTAPLLGGGPGGEGLCPQPPSHPKVFSISTSATINTSADSGRGPTPISATVAAGAPTAARVLLKQRSEDPSLRSSASTGLQTGSPSSLASPSEEASAVGRGPAVERGPVAAVGETEEDHSDKGTYTIELENRNPEEEEEARRMIDKVFGVEQNQIKGSSTPSDLKDGGCKDTGDAKTESLVCDSTWVSQWATMAAGHTRTDPEGSGAEAPVLLHTERGSESRGPDSTSSGQTERKRRTLPQLPGAAARTPSPQAPQRKRGDVGEKQDTEPQEKERHPGTKGHQASSPAPPPAENGEVAGGRRQSSSHSPSPSKPAPPRRKRSGERKGGGGGGGRDGGGDGEGRDGGGEEDKSGKPLVRQGSFTIERPSANVPAELIPIIQRGGGGGGSGRERSDSAGSMDTATLLKDTEAVMAFLEAKLRDQDQLEHRAIKTTSRTTSRTTSKTTSRTTSARPPRSTTTGGGGGSISPESDVDTASTTSQLAGEAEERRGGGGGLQKRRSLSSMHREKSSVGAPSRPGPATTGTSTTSSARERLERKAKSRAAPAPPHHPTSSSSRARQPSADLTDDDRTSSFPVSDVLSSDQEGGGGPVPRSSRQAKAFPGPVPPTATSLGKQQGALPQPRPTRASLLRRARLGDASDSEQVEADRASVASEVSTTSSTSKPPSGRRGGPTRLDVLAQPRRTRVGSIPSSARSDSECTLARGSAHSAGSSAAPATRLNAETALRLGLRAACPGDGRLTARMRANSVSKLTEAKARASTSGYCSPTVSSTSRWRRLPPEYGSTSEEEFGSHRISSSSKNASRAHLRPHHPSALHRSSRPAGGAGGSVGSVVLSSPGGVVMKHRMREQEEYIRDWTAHSEEIARFFPCVSRISQDLAKDLAVLAREIHDVAGEIDSVSSSGTAPSTTVSTAATTPGSAIDTREEVGPLRPAQPDVEESMRKLVDRVFDESLNFRKIPPVISTSKVPEINGRPVELRPRVPDSLEPRALRRRTWNREEAVLDSLLITSVSQLSVKIRHSVDKTAGKIRILFKDKDRNWDEIESKLRSESDIPLLKTSNKEISSILLELKRVEKQLQVINVMVDPDGTLDALTSLGLTSPSTPTKPLVAKTTTATADVTTSSPGSQQPPLHGTLPEILAGPPAAHAKVGDAPRGSASSRARANGEDAIANK